jgi:hypothetical protein
VVDGIINLLIISATYIFNLVDRIVDKGYSVNLSTPYMGLTVDKPGLRTLNNW